MQRSVAYILGFAAMICVVCGVLVSSSAVTLEEKQKANAALEKKTNVLQAAGLVAADERIDAEEVDRRFGVVHAKVIDLNTGATNDTIDPVTFDQQKARNDPERSHVAPDNSARVKRVPEQALVYEVTGDDGDVEMIVLPIEGVGLWSTLYGFVALAADTTTIEGLTYYDHGETPGLGGEVDNAAWKAKWPGRRAFDDSGEPRIEVIKGRAGSPDEDPFRVDGLSGASITSRAVTHMLHFWLGEAGFGPYLSRFRDGREAA
jgi:Na+-transporting NADH:ubiquinone oxidoreductase subunit C